MRNWDTRDESGTDSGCEWKKDWEDVQRVCRMLGIRCEMVRLFLALVVSHILEHMRMSEGRLVAGVLDARL